VTHISEEPFASIFKAESGERKFIQNIENYPANYTTSYQIPTNRRTFKLKKQQRDPVQLNEESKKGRKTDGQTDREKEGKRSCPQRKHHIIKRVPAISSPLARKGLYLFRPHFQPPLPTSASLIAFDLPPFLHSLSSSMQKYLHNCFTFSQFWLLPWRCK